ncbi:UMP kinase [Buchnera aphidicola (Melanaphis sacchari)]|uniref:Uridylate kinase n=1 Tax=Buchnera aphidicola (Melanaphis sacchari) TaxID=2173854 RepID=A0A2U8DFG8_9GAMM|nr:UMP kinase [Buchnera aphidicola]AWH90546.1 UMP kinase [Buchnera aphidicola (Melanaphis sacchari)]
MSANAQFIYRRILLKISGEILKGINKFGIDMNAFKRIIKEIKLILNIGIQVGLVIGSGNLFRGATLSKLGINRIAADQIGILSTVINSLVLKDIMHSYSIPSCVMSSIPLNGICETYHCEKAINLLNNNIVVIFSAGIGNPLFTTDSAACLRGIETRSDVILKGTKVNGVYSEDPCKYPNATFYKKLTYKDVLRKELKVMDLSAFYLARDHNLPIRVFNMNKPNSLYRIVTGYDEGTLITV